MAEISVHRDTDVDNTDQTLSSDRARITGYHIFNPNGTDAWFQLYDHAAPTVGTTAPTISLWVPAGGALDSPSLGDDEWDFVTAVHYAATTTAAGGTDPTTGLVANLFYRS